MKDVELGRLSWVVWMGCNWDQRLCTREAEGDAAREDDSRSTPEPEVMLLALQTERGALSQRACV